MGVELLEIGVRMRKRGSFAIKRCFRSVCNHPFLVVILCFLILLYRCCPFIFSLLLSASPVLVCTAILLGTLLSYGYPNIPEIEREERTTHHLVSMQMGVSGDVTVIEKRESCNVDTYAENKRGEMEQLIGRTSLFSDKIDETHKEDHLDDTSLLRVKSSGGIELDNVNLLNSTRKLGVTMMKHETESNEESLGDEEAKESRYAAIPRLNDDEHLESDDEKSEANSFDSERVNVDSLDSPPRSPWRRVHDEEEDEDGGEEEDDDLESGSDGAESSSPDASMADILPMLDELHPLLDEDAPLPLNMSHHDDDSDATCELSSNSSVSNESDRASENNEVGDEDNEDGEDEEDDRENKEEQTTSAITWTEEDQKNLMDLGSSEMERNQRLENLILRRRSRKNIIMMPERNLIDLENFDTGFNVHPISTARQNPFDLPRDAYDDLGLPPIPCSAPSILLPRRNPFDIPYESSEEKPNLMADRFQEEFAKLPSREPFFRRHESFNVGPSLFAPTRHEKQNVTMRPYFVPERMVSEGSSYSPLQRQSSELSDSKVSSGPETESIGSVEDSEDRKLLDEENLPVLEAVLEATEVFEEGQSVDMELISRREELSGEDVARDSEPEMEHVSEHVGHGSQSSEDEDYMRSKEIERIDVDVDETEFQTRATQDQYAEKIVMKTENILVAGNNYNNPDSVEQKLSRRSSSSSLSEVSERVFNEVVDDVVEEGTIDGVVEEPLVLRQTAVRSTDLSVRLVESIPQREPVYDSSPPADRKGFASSSISDMPINSDLDLPPISIKETINEKESEGSSQEKVEENVSHPKEEERHPLISEKERVVRIDAPPLEGQMTAGHLIDKEETIESPNSDADVYHNAHEKLISTPSAEGNASHFYDKAMHEQTFNHLDEVKVPNTPVGSFNFREPKPLANISIRDFEIDHLISPNESSSILTPDFISVPSSSEAGSPLVEMRKIIEEDDDMIEEDVDEELFSELDSVGDFSIRQCGPVSNEIEKHVASVGDGSLSSEQSTVTKVIDVSDEQNAVHPENPRESIYISEDLESNSEKADTLIVADVSCPVQIHAEASAGASETRILEDSFDQIGNKETSNINVSDPLQKDLVIKETLFNHAEDVNRGSTSLSSNFTHDEPIREIREVENSTLDHKLVDNAIRDNHKMEDDILPVARSIEAQGTTSEPSDVSMIIQNVTEREETLLDKDSSVKDITTVDTKKTDHKVVADADKHSAKSSKDKEKKSDSSSSSSSSSSSDSDD